MRVLLLAVIVGAATLPAADYQVYYLGGQSNMDGYGRVDELPAAFARVVEGVRIFHPQPMPDGRDADIEAHWAELRPGHGAGFRSGADRNEYSGRFGVELTFASTLQDLYPDRRIALVKYSRGGTAIDQRADRGDGSWDPDFLGGPRGSGVNQYDHFLATVRAAFGVADIDGDGEADRLIPAGIVWMQGESDANTTAAVALDYEDNLKRLMDLVRAALRVDDLPLAIGRISDSGRDPADGTVWNHGEIIRNAQTAFVASDPAALIVTSTDEYGYSDPWHYDSAGFLDLGRKFAEALAGLSAR